MQEILSLMLPEIDQLQELDKVLFALMGKNTSLGQDILAQIVRDYLGLENPDKPDFAHFVVSQGYVSRQEMYRLVRARNFALLRKEDKRIGRRLFRRGFLSASDLNEALEFQKQIFKALGDIKRLHDILLEEKKVSKEEVHQVWQEYRHYLQRQGQAPAEPHTDPHLLKRGGR